MTSKPTSQADESSNTLKTFDFVYQWIPNHGATGNMAYSDWHCLEDLFNTCIFLSCEK